MADIQQSHGIDSAMLDSMRRAQEAAQGNHAGGALAATEGGGMSGKPLNSDLAQNMQKFSGEMPHLASANLDSTIFTNHNAAFNMNLLQPADWLGPASITYQNVFAETSFMGNVDISNVSPAKEGGALNIPHGGASFAGIGNITSH